MLDSAYVRDLPGKSHPSGLSLVEIDPVTTSAVHSPVIAVYDHLDGVDRAGDRSSGLTERQQRHPLLP